MRAPSLVTVCEWVRDAWQQLDPTISRKAFLKCGISNALDATEDDYLWHEPDSVQETCVHSDDPLDSDSDFYDDATNASGFEEWTELFGESSSDDSTCFEGFE